MALSKWAKLAAQHSDKITLGIDKAAVAAKKSKPDKSVQIDKVVGYAKKTLDAQKNR